MRLQEAFSLIIPQLFTLRERILLPYTLSSVSLSHFPTTQKISMLQYKNAKFIQDTRTYYIAGCIIQKIIATTYVFTTT